MGSDPVVSVNLYPVHDDRGQRIGTARRRTDGTCEVRLDRPIPIKREAGQSDAVYIYIDPTPIPVTLS